jgi:hypothetical protein
MILCSPYGTGYAESSFPTHVISKMRGWLRGFPFPSKRASTTYDNVNDDCWSAEPMFSWIYAVPIII